MTTKADLAKLLAFTVLLFGVSGCPCSGSNKGSSVSSASVGTASKVVAAEGEEEADPDACIRPTKEDDIGWHKEARAKCFVASSEVAPIQSGGVLHLQVTFKMTSVYFDYKCFWYDLNSDRSGNLLVERDKRKDGDYYSFSLPRSSFPEQFYLFFEYKCHNAWRWDYNPHGEKFNWLVDGFRGFSDKIQYSCKTHRKKEWSACGRDGRYWSWDMPPQCYYLRVRVAANKVLKGR